MKAFATLVGRLDASNSTLRKVAVLADYLRTAPPGDAAWAVYFLAGGKPRQSVPTRLLRDAARAAAGIPEWLFDECYLAVGDLAETIAHVLPAPDQEDGAGLAEWMDTRLLPLRGLPAAEASAVLHAHWRRLDWGGRFVMNKLITGGFRVGVSRPLVVRAIARAFDLDDKLVAQRFVGYTESGSPPDAARYLALVAGPDEAGAAGAGHPYPFFLAQSLQQDPAVLGDPLRWIIEWKWDGIRAQLVLRSGGTWLWSRGEELITERFPEIVAAAGRLRESAGDGLVIDGELLAWDAAAARPLPFAALQTRITRKTLTPAVLRRAPAAFVAYDLLERHGHDWRGRPQLERREALQGLVAGAGTPCLLLSPRVEAQGWEALRALHAGSRERGVEGFMLKRADARYGIGRTKADGIGEWWKWKVAPYTVDAVLVYAQRGHGRRASLYTDYTFAVWDPGPGGVLVPFAKAYSGLTDEDIHRVDAIVRRTTVERFGPVRSVTPALVFELGFEAIAESPRHKSGLAVRFPRILRWRVDKPVEQADTLASLRALLPS